MSAVLDPHGHAHGGHADDHDHAHGQPHGWRRWLYATNHKDIGTMYLLFSFTMLMIGGILALCIRLELFSRVSNSSTLNCSTSSPPCTA